MCNYDQQILPQHPTWYQVDSCKFPLQHTLKSFSAQYCGCYADSTTASPPLGAFPSVKSTRSGKFQLQNDQLFTLVQLRKVSTWFRKNEPTVRSPLSMVFGHNRSGQQLPLDNSPHLNSSSGYHRHRERLFHRIYKLHWWTRFTVLSLQLTGWENLVPYFSWMPIVHPSSSHSRN